MYERIEREDINWNQVRRFAAFVGVTIPIFLLVLYLYKALMIPFFIGLFLAFVLSPLVEKLDRFKIPRGLIVSGMLALSLLFIAIVLIKILPFMYVEILGLTKMAPKVYQHMIEQWYPILREYALSTELVSASEFDHYIKDLGSLVQASARVQEALQTVWNTAPKVLGTVVNLVMIPLFAFFLLKDSNKIKRYFRTLIPTDLVSPVQITIKRVSRTLRAVIKGQFIVACILAFLYVTGLSIVGIHAAVAIGLTAGLCRIIPYFDVIVGGILSLIVVFSDYQGSGQLLGVFLVFAIVQSIDGMLITPRVIGERVGLHPVVVIVSILAFSEIMGFWGVLLAIPIVAVAKVLWFSAAPFYLASRAYDPD